MNRDSRALASLLAGRPTTGGPKPTPLTAVVEQVTATSPLTCQPLSGGTPAQVQGHPSGVTVGALVLVLELGAGLRVAVTVL